VTDELATILRLVEEGRLTPEEAAPLVAALSERPSALRSTEGAPRQLRIRVSESGRQVVNLRVPLSVAGAALRMVPGLRGEQAERVRAALSVGVVGPVINVDDPNGDSVLISLE
jgi:hypothetical protein